MARYCVPYRGSKSRIAPWVVERLFVHESHIDEYRKRMDAATAETDPVEKARRSRKR